MNEGSEKGENGAGCVRDIGLTDRFQIINMGLVKAVFHNRSKGYVSRCAVDGDFEGISGIRAGDPAIRARLDNRVMCVTSCGARLRDCL